MKYQSQKHGSSPGLLGARVCRSFLACALAFAMTPSAALAQDIEVLEEPNPVAQDIVVEQDGSNAVETLAEDLLVCEDEPAMVTVQNGQQASYDGAVTVALVSATQVQITGLNGYRTRAGQFEAMTNPTATITCEGTTYATDAPVQNGIVAISGNVVVGTYTVVVNSENYAPKTVTFSYPAVSSATIGGSVYEYVDADVAFEYVDQNAKDQFLAACQPIGTTSIYYKVADGSTALAGKLYGMDMSAATSYSSLYNALIGGNAAASDDYDTISSATGIVANAHYGQLSTLVARNIVNDKTTITSADATLEQKLANKLTGAYCTTAEVADPTAYVEAYLLNAAGKDISAEQANLLKVRLNGNATINPTTVTDRVAVDTVTSSGFFTGWSYFDPTALSGSKAYGHIKLVIRPTAGDNSTGGTPFSWADYYASVYAGTISNGTTTVGMAPWIDLYTEAGHSAVEMSISNGTNPYNMSNMATVNRFASLYDPASGRLKAGNYTVTIYAAGYNPLSYTFSIGGVVPTDDLSAIEFANVDTAALEGKTATVTAYAPNDGSGNAAIAGEDYATDALVSNGKVQLAKTLVPGDYKVVADGVTYTFTASEKPAAKKANPISATVTAPAALTFKTSKQTLANPLKVTGAQGKVTFAKASGSKYVAVAASNGRLTVAKNTPAGTYTIKVKVTAAGNDEYEAGSVTKSFTVKVNKAVNTFVVKAVKAKQAASAKKNTVIAVAKAFKVTKNVSKGKVTYKKTSGNAKITVAKTGKVTVKKGLKKGTYTVKVKATSAATKNYKAANANITFKVVVK